MSKERLITIGTLAALCLMAAFSLHAKAAGQEGMVVVRDPQTGKMRAPTPDELREL
ncbi:post-PEP-CTERM-1 domain-containing protein, partial [Massilia phosphatilytica]